MKNEGVKLLAAIMVLTVAFAGIVVVSGDSSADESSSTIYVSDSGVDTATGTQSAPFKTIAKALEKKSTIIVLLSDIQEKVEIAGESNVVIDLNGYTLSYPTADSGAIPVIMNHGALTIKDSSSASTGKITRTGDNDHYVIVNEGTLTIDGGEVFTVKEKEDTASLIINNKDCLSEKPAKLVINGGKVTSYDSNCIKNDEYGIVEVNGGTFTQNSSLENHNALLITYGNAKITGGTFVQEVEGANCINAASYGDQTSTLEISGGSFKSTGNAILFGQDGNSDSDKVDVIVSGGLFQSPIGIKAGTTNVKTLMVDADVSFVGTSDLTNLTIVIGKGSSLTVGEGTIIDETVLKNTKENLSSSATLTGITAGAGGVTLSEGSVVISGPIAVGEVAQIVAEGDVVLENAVIIGPAGEDEGSTITVTGKLTIRGNVILPEKVKLSAAENNLIEIESNSTLSVSGELDGNVTNNGTIAITNVNAEIPSSVGGSGNVDTSAVASEGTLSGTYHTTTKFTQNQAITATGDITLVKGTVFTFEGLFIIPEGVTVTIEDGAKLVIATSTGKLENNGTIVIESKASAEWPDRVWKSGYEGAFVLSDGEVINEGTINLEYTKPETGSVGGWVMNIASGSFTNNGAINVGEDSELAINGYFLNNGTLNLDGEIVVNNNGGITMSGYTPEAMILNAGEIILSGNTIAKEVTIYITSLDAVVKFNGMASRDNMMKVTVSDARYVDTTKTFEIETSVESEEVESKVTVDSTYYDSVSGLEVRLDVVKDETVSATTAVYDKVLLMNGAVSASTTKEESEVVAVGVTTYGDVMVVGELSMTENVSLKVLGNLSVPGKITYTVKDSKGGISMDTDATMTVTGMVSGNDKGITKAENAKINGVYYKIDGVSPAPTMYYYTTMSVAAQSGAKTIEVLGTVEVSEDVTIPAKMTLDNTKGTLTVAKDVKLVMAAESKLKNGTGMNVDVNGTVTGVGILVNGTLYIEDLKGTKAPGMIISDVVKDGTADRTYTNLTVALTTAVSGDVIKLSNNATISKDSTIPAGVTVDTNNKNLTVDTDTTLTIDGVLFISGATGKLILNPEDGSGNIVKKAGAVELNGAVRSIIAISEDLEIAGAYYSITESGKKTYFVEPVANVTSKVTTFDGTATDNSVVEIKTFNDKFQMPDVTFSGNADKKVIVTIKGQVTAKTITLDVAELRIDNNVKFTGTVTNVVGTVSFNGTAVADLVVRSTTKDAAKELTVSGGFDAADKKNTSFSGDVSLSGMTSDVTVIDGNAKVVENSNLGKTTVNGTISVDISKRLTVADMFVFGTVDAADATEAGSAADVVANNVYLGLKKTEVYSTGAAATIDGKFQINGLMYVLDGSVVPADLVEDKKSLQVFVEDKLWMTVYAMGTTTTVSINEIPVDEVDLKGWVDDKGNSVANPIEIKDNKVYASIDYNVYAVSFTICAGIDNVYIDGVLVDTGIFAPEFKVAAGEHTVSYTLANGYSGTATMLVNGEKVTGYKFNASGDFETVSYGITIQGIEKSGYVPESPDTPVQPSEKDDDDMGLTEYLLIVLVILAAILVVVVAIRMMRS